MKKISKELLKTYYWVIFLFTIFSVFIIINFSIYLWKENKNDIKLMQEYIEYEITALDERTDGVSKSKGDILMEIVEDAPKLRDVYLEIFYNDKKYAKAPFLPDKRHNFLDYYSVTKIYNLENFNEVKVNITRRNVRDRKLIINAFASFIFFLLFCLLIIIKIQKKFFDKFKNSIDNLKIFTQDYDLNSKIKIHNEENFIEFSILQKSFKNMLSRLEEQSQSQSNFVNNASHELKTPIFVLKGYVDMLNDWGKNDKEVLDESLVILKKEIQNMQDLTEKLLFLAKSKNLVVEKNNISLDNALKEVIDNLNFAYPKQKINYISSEIFIDSDIALLKLLFKNLIENAIKYGKDNPVNIELKKEKKVKVIIEDFGVGISEKALPHIFERFYREDEARNREIKSYGLGLSIVNEILSLLDIDIQVDSELGKGTKITLEI
ncbi:MAG: sensor histidine kinase [Fusobacterium sp.]|uniref:sensor histidine kinase n=1 Tax=Fusobacterium sp. TaxID=68766 RepID=UPI003FA09BF0